MQDDDSLTKHNMMIPLQNNQFFFLRNVTQNQKILENSSMQCNLPKIQEHNACLGCDP